MVPALRGRSALKNAIDSLPHAPANLTSSMLRFLSFNNSSIDGAQSRSTSVSDKSNSNAAVQSAGRTGYNGDVSSSGYTDVKDGGRQNPPEPIAGRPLRGEKPRTSHPSRNLYQKQLNPGAASACQNHVSHGKLPPGVSTDGVDSKSFLESLKLGFDRKGENNDFRGGSEKKAENPAVPQPTEQPSYVPQDADEIFKKMKETGLIPNAVAMLDGLCKDGLFQEAMKLFGLMREKGTMPEVVIYTAVVDGFCKANKLDDAMRIFRKMQNRGVSPNAFSFTILIQGLYMGNRLEDALDFCLEMLEAGHSLNLTTFTGLVNAFCHGKGLDEAQNLIASLRQKGFVYDERAVKEHMDKKGTFLPVVWEAILGKKNSKKSF